ncbi:Ada metal-binding domain-containing protein [Empedobacter brevis]|uniref:Ada metal-binding domain-containing protein n=1 Tax=Empedobacter brevis TaxID=247 RepID=UPI00289B548B|nr:Ada metal-binding domain-containing protein [Empedobacter brevis]
MIKHTQLKSEELKHKIRHREILFGGNQKLKIYGQLNCTSGKRMKIENRVFFTSEQDAIAHHFRPCGHCMKVEYLKWKNGLI